MGLEHDNPNAASQDAPRTQRLTADESRAVIARWQRERVEQTGLTDHPAVPDVAEGLDIPIEEVQRLLGEVRALRLEEERALAQDLLEVRLAEEESQLAEVQRQRVQLRREPAHRQRRTAPHEQWVQVKPGVWEDLTVAPPAWGYSEHEGLESQHVGRTLTKVCALVTFFCLIAAALALSGVFDSHRLAPCYVNGEPMPTGACRGVGQATDGDSPNK